ncbi:type IV secretion system DNA-binding domain-containing protein [Herbaspirillum aquaticum]|uniref:Type IV secretion system coupling protein TraD DNA-binding domain-containing protein n=1 Tax=Herbaspirillum aquaticum TaxID=568783 RepID=A0A225SL68_9BURK|nr:type IV secretion system DNA-binding domain-containing protein [Herbaspirillum aquaticum]OWY31726.1 hypothetical protein CEJ45_24300 [Herbaspirillum aquaticum]
MQRQRKSRWGRKWRQIPSLHSRDPLGWLVASVISGLFFFFLSLGVLWRPFWSFQGPPGALSVHVWHWLASLIHAAFPSLFSKEAAHYKALLVYWAGTGEWAAMHGRIFIAGCCGILPAIVWAHIYLVPRDGLIYLRGAKRHEGEDAVRQLNRYLLRECRECPDHSISPFVTYPATRWTRHVLMVGGVGAGKSSVAKPLIKKIIKSNERLILFDPKGDFTKAFEKPVIVGPWDARGFGWNIGKDIRTIGDMRRFAAAMIKEGKDPMWSNAARQIQVGLTKYLNANHGLDWSWRELAVGLSTPAVELLGIMRQHHPEAVRAVEKFSVTTQGILINLASYCSAIYDLADAWEGLPKERMISFSEWTKEDPKKNRQIILQGHGGYPEVTQAYVQGILSVISSIISSVEIDDDPNRKIWICADEAAEMGNVPIRQLFSMGRSRGVRCFLICQDLVQLEDIYGKNFVRALLSMSGTLLVGKVGPGNTADTLAKAMGSHEVERKNISVTRPTGGGPESATVSYSRETIPLYHPSELGSRLGADVKEGGVVMALVTGGDAYELFFPFQNFPDQRPAIVPSKWVCPPQGRQSPVTSQAEIDQEEAEEHPF